MEHDENAIGSLIAAHRDALAEFEKKIPDLITIRDALLALISRDGLLMLCGNGGSAADAIHWAAEWRVRFKKDRRALRAEALVTDVSTLTAAGNDFGYETVFSRQVEAVGRKGDALVVFSTSGNSENILRAIATAKAQGILTIGFGGKDGGKMAPLVDIPFIIPHSETARIQEMHELAMHILCELVDESLTAPQR